ncbi:MAG TPA: cation:proton antiporter [Planktothrix sp.]|jgi:Kef-type K+ transport system membrane component KefB
MSFWTLFIIIIAGLIGLVPSGFRRVTVPLVMGEILAGILCGTSGFHILNPADPILQFFSSVGFAMLMFLIGTKLPLRNPDLHGALRHSITALVLALAVACPVALFLSHVTSLHSMPMFLLLLSCSSTAVVMPMVLERKLQGNLVLQITTWVMVADIATVASLPLAMYPNQLPRILLGAVIITAVAYLCMKGLKLFRQSDFGDYYRGLSKERGWALDLRLSLAILFGLSALAMRFGTSILIAGFAAGAIVAVIAHPKRFLKQLTGIAEGFFVPLFFVDLGARLDFTQLFHSPHFLVLTFSIVAGSILVHLIVAKTMRLPSVAGWMAASQQGLPIALVSIGLSTGTLSAGQGAAIIAAMMFLLASAGLGTARLARMLPPPPPDQKDDDPQPPPARTDEQ